MPTPEPNRLDEITQLLQRSINLLQGEEKRILGIGLGFEVQQENRRDKMLAVRSLTRAEKSILEALQMLAP